MEGDMEFFAIIEEGIDIKVPYSFSYMYGNELSEEIELRCIIENSNIVKNFKATKVVVEVENALKDKKKKKYSFKIDPRELLFLYDLRVRGLFHFSYKGDGRSFKIRGEIKFDDRHVKTRSMRATGPAPQPNLNVINDDNDVNNPFNVVDDDDIVYEASTDMEFGTAEASMNVESLAVDMEFGTAEVHMNVEAPAIDMEFGTAESSDTYDFKMPPPPTETENKCYGGALVITDLAEHTKCQNRDIVYIQLGDKTIRSGKVLVVDGNGNKAVVQVFEGSSGIHSKLPDGEVVVGKALEFGVAKEMLGGTFDGSGKSIDGTPGIKVRESIFDISGCYLNPSEISFPKEMIQTAISTFDVMSPITIGQKIPLFSSSGLPHDEIVAQICGQACLKPLEKSDNLHEGGKNNFGIVVAAMGVNKKTRELFKEKFEGMNTVTLFLNMEDDPIIERLMAPRLALTFAEFLAFQCDMHILVVLTDMSSYTEALLEVFAASTEVDDPPTHIHSNDSRTYTALGYQGAVEKDLSSIYNRVGGVQTYIGSVTMLPVITIREEGGDIKHVNSRTGFINDAKIYLKKQLHSMEIFPPVDILPSLSQPTEIAVGMTRSDHAYVSIQLFICYASGKHSRAKKDEGRQLSYSDKLYLNFLQNFERRFVSQGNQARTLSESLDLAWELLRDFPKDFLDHIPDNLISEYHSPPDPSADRRWI